LRPCRRLARWRYIPIGYAAHVARRNAERAAERPAEMRGAGEVSSARTRARRRPGMKAATPPNGSNTRYSADRDTERAADFGRS
jgi:hypothetical protein